MNIVAIKDKLERARSTMANVRQKAKALTHEVVETALAAATAGAIGAYDEAKGETRENDMGYRTANIGPVPASLAVAAVGKAVGITQLGDESGRLASAIGQGALDAAAYIQGRRLWARHAQQSK